ncbi:efflux RND transporter permease subunit [Arcticibacterium luteifluviistationis]|uniref:Multidrug transporter AcrB n=1 Tax=Arcticibacterium luteifluviistationis TaxID=1784714 RepID=A0A2Z4GEZ9_9BACT|nr:efflux RND transporter permease subunit [Arcticibacterium luteifluviistationis]AWV99790.1 multidrug transporter AcrB [Arcticibacterium luteifluviistationis]
MKIAEFSVKNYQFTIIIFVMIVALGVSSLLTMPKAEDPVLKATFNTIVVIYPGTGPKDMEKLIVDPIEDRLNGLDDVKNIFSVSGDGVANITVEFMHHVDDDEKYGETLRELNAIRNKLPEDIYSLDVFKYTPESVNILQAALMSETAPYHEMKEKAEELKDALEKVKDIKGAEVHAFPNREVKIALNTDRMAQYKIPINRVMGLIQAENTDIPAGSIEIGDRRLNVKTSGSYKSLEEIENTIVSTSGTQVTYLKDIAEVSMGYEEITYKARLNGKRAVFITATQKNNTNIFDVKSEVEPIISNFQENLPANLTYETSFDQANSVSKRLLGLARDFCIAILLVMITLIPLGFRAALIVMVSIPLSLAIGLAGLDIMGFGINQLSVVGLVIALGLVVDDSIVVVENIARFLREGYSRKEAAVLATKQIGLAVVGCTATLLFAFLPLIFLPESSGEFIRSLPMAVIATVLASLFVSITIVPFLASMIMPKHSSEEGNIVLQYMKKGIEGSYRKILHWSLSRPLTTLLIAVLIFAGSLALIPVIGISVFPKSEKPQLLIDITTPVGTNLETTDKVVRFVEKTLSEEEIVRNYAANIGKDNPRIYYNLLPRGGASSEFAQLFVQLQEDTEVPDRTVFVNELRDKFADYPGAKIVVKEFEQGPPVAAPLAVRVYGENIDSLRNLSIKVENAYKETEGTIYINNPATVVNTDLRVNINRDKAGMFGIPTAEIDKSIRMAISGLNIGEFRDEAGDEYAINVGLKDANNSTFDVFDKIYVPAASGAQVPLKALATVQFESSPNNINHYDKERYVLVSSFVADGYLTPSVNEKFIEKLEQIEIPEGYRYQISGEVERQKETFGGLGNIIIITIFGILAILILEFKTFKSSFIVLSVIPLGIIGAVSILYLTGNSLSFTATIGIIALAGIEIKNSILLVDYTNFLRSDEGLSIDAAIEKAGETRFIPIVLTTLTAIGGLTPLVLEHSPLYSPLALVIIGGLISSLVLTRIVTPVMYKLLPPKVELRK